MKGDLIDMQQENNAPSDLCHACQYGGQIVERCNCPYLRAWGVIPRTLKNTLLLSNAEAVAKSKGIEDYNPLCFVAVTAAVVNDFCRYYKPRKQSVN